jgi:hypothetical protein
MRLTFELIRTIYSHSNTLLKIKLLNLNHSVAFNIVLYLKPNINILTNNFNAMCAIKYYYFNDVYFTILINELFRLKYYEIILKLDFKLDHYLACHIFDINHIQILKQIFNKLMINNKYFISISFDPILTKKLLIYYLTKYPKFGLNEEDILNALCDANLNNSVMLFDLKNINSYDILKKVILIACEVDNIDVFNIIALRLNLLDLFDICFKTACDNNSINIVKLIINLNHYNILDFRFFAIVCKNNYIELIKLFIDIYKKQNLLKSYLKRLNSNFISACESGFIEQVNLFIEINEVNNYYNYEYGFIDACENNHLEIVKLLKKYISIFIINIGFYAACRHQHMDVYDYLINYVSKDYMFYGVLLLFNYDNLL